MATICAFDLGSFQIGSCSRPLMEARSLTQRLGGTWRNGRGQAPCPCCQTERRRDQVALSISQAGDKLLLWCFKSGCSFVEIANAAGAELMRVQIDFVTQAKHEHFFVTLFKTSLLPLMKAFLISTLFDQFNLLFS